MVDTVLYPTLKELVEKIRKVLVKYYKAYLRFSECLFEKHTSEDDNISFIQGKIFGKLLSLFESGLWKITSGRHCWELIAVAEKAKVRQWLETKATAMKKRHKDIFY